MAQNCFKLNNYNVVATTILIELDISLTENNKDKKFCIKKSSHIIIIKHLIGQFQVKKNNYHRKNGSTWLVGNNPVDPLSNIP